MQVAIRKFQVKDLKRVYEIEKESFKDPYNPFFLLQLYELFSDTFLVAEVGGRVVGYIIARRVGTRGHIIAIAVDPKYRGRGIGTILMQVILEKLKKRGVEIVWLEVRISNKRAISFYRKLGFEYTDFYPRYYADGEDAIILTLRLY